MVLNENIPAIPSTANSDPYFILSVYPAVLREVLTRMIFIEGDVKRLDDLPMKWHERWVQFAKIVHPEGNPPDILDPESSDFSEKEVLEWITQVVEEFSELRGDEWQEYLNQIEKGIT